MRGRAAEAAVHGRSQTTRRATPRDRVEHWDWPAYLRANHERLALDCRAARAQHLPMNDVAVIEPDAGERLAFLGASTMRLKLDGGSEGALAFYEYVSEPGVIGPLQHIHHAHDETFYVVAGTYEFTLGRELIVMQPGGFLSVPRGTPHTFRRSE